MSNLNFKVKKVLSNSYLIEEIAKIFSDEYDMSLEEYIKRCKDYSYTFFVLFLKNEIVSVARITGNNKKITLEALITNKKFRGKRLATILINYLKTNFKEVEVKCYNKKLADYYKSIGFSLISFTPKSKMKTPYDDADGEYLLIL